MQGPDTKETLFIILHEEQLQAVHGVSQDVVARPVRTQ